MQHFRSLHGVLLQGSWVTIGSFDGVHLGHQAIIRRLVEGAHSQDLPAVAITFFPHPSKVLRGNGAPFYLTTPEERAEFLAGLNLDVVITLRFDKELAAFSADQFMGLLASHLGLKRLLVGHDFALGRGREGNFAVLENLGLKYGYGIEGLAPLTVNGELVSSSRIRELVGQGNISLAAAYLGRFYSVQGIVVPGDGRGRTIGIPTANLEIWHERLLPANGVYATLAQVNGVNYPSVTNVGVRPTFENQSPQPRVETHLLDFKQDLYGMNLNLEFMQYLRPEQRFASVQALIEQIRVDIEHAREVVSDGS
jgi:riboflavin kinase/FMN adenylyltransferase